ncbi:MAG: PP2C family protein-serine/threonine phosphatase [Leptospiraceae bacterium]|nr:PP2C family protein-serine/threonine phosphatase [Leptospiraceae bacterium]
MDFSGVDVLKLTTFFGSMLLLVLPLWPLQMLRGRGFREPFLVYICLLWFLSFFTGGLNFASEISLDGVVYRFRLSSGIYTLIFAALLLVYVAEGINEARKVIMISIGCQIFLIAFQVFLYQARGTFLKEADSAIVHQVLEPRVFNIGVSIFNTVLDLFLAVVLFQFLVNRLKRVPLSIIMFSALWATMMLDSVIYVGLTRPGTFKNFLTGHIIFKTSLLVMMVFPLAFFIRRFRKDSDLNLNRGSLDIFKKLENLEKDLEKAHTELKAYAQNLEKMVAERTKEIRAKSEVMERELELATEVQQAMLPASETLASMMIASLYRPCHEVSGDLYDYAELPDGRVFIFIADISGHGVPSALVGAMCKMSLGSQDFSRTNAGDILKKLSEAMKKVTTSHYLTGIIMLIDPRQRTIEYANGGHVPCFLQSSQSAFLPMDATGTVIGSFISAPYDFKKIAYPPGTRLVLFTDGIVEQKNAAREEFGQDRFQAALTELRAQKPAVVLGELYRRATDFAGTEKFSDDVTLLIADLP